MRYPLHVLRTKRYNDVELCTNCECAAAAIEEHYMPSPFPGMNPYLEQADVWQDFHQSFIPLLRQLLSEQVRPKYLVKIEEQLFIHELPEDQRQLLGRGDMTVSRSDADSTGTAVVLLKASAIGRVPLSVDVARHAFLEIRDRGHR